jgi:hypothetical protein
VSTPDDTRFDSWKEIAIYLGRDLRTLRRWEKERGLPVHRVPGEGRRAIFAFSAILMKVDAHGEATRHFVNYGHLRSLNEIRTTAGNFLLAGGVNNETDEGALAVLREEDSAGSSPQKGELATCEGCPAGRPYRYFLFPRSEVNQKIGPAYNTLSEIIVTGTRIQVMTSETAEASPPADWAMYEISADDFAPRAVSFSDHYWLTHQRLSAEGKIGHGLEKCPERIKPIAVREWSEEQGWTKVELPPVTAVEK